MRIEKNNQILEEFAPFLWSYDISKMDPERHKKRIITNVLNWGTKEATDKLMEIYSREDIKETIKNPLPGEWSGKSLNYWSIIFNVHPKRTEDALRDLDVKYKRGQ